MTVSKKLIENVKELRKALNEISVYDLDVYTSMELYYKIANKLNEVIKELMRFEGVVSDEVIKQNEKLIYLLGEGLNIEVVKKINQMIEDGTMDSIINHNVFNSLNNKIDECKEELSSQIKDIEDNISKSINEYKQDTDVDYTNAFRRYFEDVKSNKIDLFLPKGRFIVSETIQLPKNTYFSLFGSGRNTIIEYTGNDTLFKFENSDTGNIYITGMFRDLSIIGTKTSYAIKEVGAYTSGVSFNNCRISGFLYAIWLERAYWTNIINCEISSNVNGVYLSGANSSKIINSFFRFNTEKCLVLGRECGLNGSSGVMISGNSFDNGMCGIEVDCTLICSIIGNYFEIGKGIDTTGVNKSITVSKDGCLYNCYISGNYARYDNRFYITNSYNTTMISNNMTYEFPSDSSGKIESLYLLNHKHADYYIYNKKMYEDNIIEFTSDKKSSAWSLLTSNPPVTSSRETVTIEAGQEYTIADILTQRSFRLYGFSSSNIWKCNVRVYNGEDLVFETKKDFGESSFLEPLFKLDYLQNPKLISIKIHNPQDTAVTLNNLTVTYSSNLYTS